MNENNIEFPIVYNKGLQKNDFIEWMEQKTVTRIKIFFIVVIASCAVFYALLFVTLILGMKPVSMFYIVLVSICLIIALFFRFGIGRLLGSLKYKQYCMTQNKCKSSIAFYNDRLETIVGNEIVTTLPYANITKTILTNHLLIIIFPNFVNCIVRRDGFSESDFEIIQALVSNGTESEKH